MTAALHPQPLTFRIVDRRQSYFMRSALERAKDATEFLRRFHKGESIKASLRRPKVAQANIVPIRKKAAR